MINLHMFRCICRCRNKLILNVYIFFYIWVLKNWVRGLRTNVFKVYFRVLFWAMADK